MARTQCNICKGTGTCDMCYGTGIIRYEGTMKIVYDEFTKKPKNCNHCKGTGKCKYCNGTGYNY